MRRLLFSKGAKKSLVGLFWQKHSSVTTTFQRWSLLQKMIWRFASYKKLKSRKQKVQKTVNWQYDAEMYSFINPPKSYWSVIWHTIFEKWQIPWYIFRKSRLYLSCFSVMKGYGAHGLRLPDKWSELIFVTYDLWKWSPWGLPGVPKFLPTSKNILVHL